MGDPLAGLKLCHINLARGYRGGERQTELLVAELAQRGYVQHLVVRPGNPLAKRCAEIPNLAITEVGRRVAGAALATRESDLLHAHEAQAFYAAALANLLFGKPYALTRRVPNPQRPSFARRISYRRAGRLIGVSDAVAKNVHALYPDLDVTVVPDAHACLAADEAVVQALRARYPGKQLIGHIGALDDGHKGQRTILAAARRALAEGRDWQFLLCGDGKDEAALKQEAYGLDNLTFEGYVDNPGDYLASFDLFVFPSNFEALGSSLLDAMYFGLPIVASDVGGIPEVVEEGVNGWLIEPGDGKALFERVDQVLAEEEQRSRMAAANRQKAARYSAARMTDAYVEIYRSLL
jgi:glycosyltransferase involved in cell wall biosynthesis